jgi:hypothetical protein
MEKHAVEMKKMFHGYCPECGSALELEPEEMEGTKCPGCEITLDPYCEDE